MNWKPITVSSKILGHIGAGVYRSAGGAIKELVSNAFDADATKVVITTNSPSFDIVTCYDNGSGMTPKQFEKIMSGGIGDSTKRIGENELSNQLHRPLIGRLGIGMLGIAQICHEFKIISHHSETKTAFEASVKLVDHLREKVEEVNPENEKPVDVGQFDIIEINYDERQKGTRIIATDMRAAVVRKFREQSEVALPSKFSAFVDRIYAVRSLSALGDYWQMVWELCIDCPIPYLEDSPFKWSAVDHDHTSQEVVNSLCDRLNKFKFEVIVDGLSLRKPNFYPSPQYRRNGSVMTGRIFPIRHEAKIYGRPLKLSGYIYLQDGQAIEPMDLRGLLIRIRNVAIGGYDPKLLSYPGVPTPRFSWLSGEIYVEEGLEQALNIDRDSFNQTHEHYVALQRTIHGFLPEIFSDASTGVRERSQSKNKTESNRIEEALKELVNHELNAVYSFREDETSSLPLIIDTDSKQIVVNNRSLLWPKSKAKRDIARRIALAFEASLQVPEHERRERFYNLLTKILDL